jgi:hypothetical protein
MEEARPLWDKAQWETEQVLGVDSIESLLGYIQIENFRYSRKRTFHPGPNAGSCMINPLLKISGK